MVLRAPRAIESDEELLRLLETIYEINAIYYIDGRARVYIS